MTVRRTQRERILDLLLVNRGHRVSSPDLSKISLQYGARVKELRSLGYGIRNEIERVNGQVHGYFILDTEPEPIIVSAASAEPDAITEAGDLFGSIEPISSMLDHECGRTQGGH